MMLSRALLNVVAVVTVSIPFLIFVTLGHDPETLRIAILGFACTGLGIITGRCFR